MSTDFEGLKLRKKSNIRADDTSKQDEHNKTRPDRPCHKSSDSLLSGFSGQNDLTGFLTWFLLVLSVAASCLLLENINKYGLRIDHTKWMFLLTGSRNGVLEILFIQFLLYSTVPAGISLLLEKGIAKSIIPASVGTAAHILNFSQLLIIPVFIIFQNTDTFSLIAAMYVCFLYIVQFLKLCSYVQVNYWCRKQRGFTSAPVMENDSLAHYPDNLTVKDMAYFFFAPTLCYELNFPRTDHIRMRFLLKCILEFILLTGIVLCLSQQWMAPCVNSALLSVAKNESAMKTVENTLKLAVPAAFIWIALFYVYFHCFLNILGEILCFGDRSFYYDWWNATSMDVHWRKWNVPVYKWALRHIYKPLRESGYSRRTGKFVVFTMSAFFHEYLYCVILRVMEWRTFASMSGQV